MSLFPNHTPAAAAETSRSDIEARIDRVVNHVLVQDPNAYYKFNAATLKERMEHYHNPGVSIAVINQGRLEWARGFGVMEWGKTNPIADTTLFQAASISKPIFALGVMHLVQDGKLNLDEDVNRSLKSWKVPPNQWGQPTVTLRQILGHTAGFTVHGFPGYATTGELPTVVQILNGQLPANTSPVIVTLIPGSQYRYSGGGTTVAQLLVTDVIGKPFPEIMREQVLQPLGMTHSTYEQPLPESLHASAASGHYPNYRVVLGRWHVYPEMAPAGLWTTPTDLARAAIEVQRAVAGDTNTAITPTVATEMLNPGLGGCGIGFFMSGSGANTRFGHGGANEGFRSQLTAYEHTGVGAVIMVNSDEGGNLIPEIERAIAQEYNWPDYFPRERKAADVNMDDCNGLIGQYRAADQPVFIIRREKNRFMGRLFGQRDAELFPESKTNFFFGVVDAQLSFKCDAKGRGTGLVLHQHGNDIPFEKISDAIIETGNPLTAAECARQTNSPLQGCWRAVIGSGTRALHLAVRIAGPSDGKYRAELDAIEQKGYGQPLWVIDESPSVKLVVMTGHGMFEGKLNDTATTISGHWIQGGQQTPLTLTREIANSQ